MDIQKEREAFQKFCEENFDFERHEQTYFDEQTQCYENDIGEDTESINMAWSAWQAAKAQAVPEGFVLVPKGLTHEQAARISDDENFFETYQTILTESDTSEDSAVILIQTAHKAMIEAQEPAND